MGTPLGFKTFNTGDVLTAADTNGYLMQGVWTFASAAARDAAVTSPQEGNVCYLKDTDAVMTYSGSAWVAVGGGGGWTLASTTTLSGASTSLTIPSGYKQVVVYVDNFQLTASAATTFTFNSDASSIYGNMYIVGTGTTASPYFEITTKAYIGGGGSPNSGNNKNFLALTINNPDDTAAFKTWSGIETSLVSTQRQFSYSGNYNTTTAITSLQLKAGASTWAGGTAYVYGVK